MTEPQTALVHVGAIALSLVVVWAMLVALEHALNWWDRRRRPWR